MKLSKRFWLSVIIVLGLLVGYTVLNKDEPSDSTPVSVKQAEIVFSNDNKQVNYLGVEGETALVTLDRLADISTKTESFGAFVTGIGEVNAEDGKTFWAFYVNDKMAEVGAGSFQPELGDKIEWRLEDIEL